jgi:hypothetical protein
MAGAAAAITSQQSPACGTAFPLVDRDSGGGTARVEAVGRPQHEDCMVPSHRCFLLGRVINPKTPPAMTTACMDLWRDVKPVCALRTPCWPPGWGEAGRHYLWGCSCCPGRGARGTLVPRTCGAGAAGRRSRPRRSSFPPRFKVLIITHGSVVNGARISGVAGTCCLGPALEAPRTGQLRASACMPSRARKQTATHSYRGMTGCPSPDCLSDRAWTCGIRHAAHQVEPPCCASRGTGHSLCPWVVTTLGTAYMPDPG